ncbi:hypothetical protein [Christiangramia sp. LLG6405-1]|uniref:hypothetical protein n=1 Tax=Christiangramia sp. LLG6405-1 TaxID=3160832 RepID=UPI00386A0D9C
MKLSEKWTNINSDKVLSISAMIISLATLILIFYQTDLIRKEQKASVFPSIMVGYNINTAKGITGESIFIINQGLGPAFIQSISVENDGKEYNVDPYEYIQKADNFNKSEVIYIDKLFEGRIIPVNDKIILVAKKTDSISLSLGETFDFHFNSDFKDSINSKKAIIEITYKNVYGDVWKVRSDKASAIELN